MKSTDVALLCPVQQEMVEQHTGHHGLADRNCPDSDTGVVTPLRDDRGFIATECQQYRVGSGLTMPA